MQPADQPEDFSFIKPVESAPSASRSVYRRKKTPWWQTPGAIITAVLLLVAAGVAAVVIANRPESGSLKLAEAEPFSISESQPWSYRPGLKLHRVPKSSVRYELIDAPPGMSINSKKGEIAWTPAEDDGPGEYRFAVRVSSGTLSDELKLTISVEETGEALVFDSIPRPEVKPGDSVEVMISASDPDQLARSIRYTLDEPHEVEAQLDANSGRFAWKVPREIEAGEYSFGIRASEEGGRLSEQADLVVTVTGTSSPADSGDPLVEDLRLQGATVSLLDAKPDMPEISGEGRTLRINGGEVRVFRYLTTAALEKDASHLTQNAAKIFGEAVPHVFGGLTELAIYEGTEESTIAALEEYFGEPLALNAPSEDPDEPTEELPQSDPDVETLATLFRRDRLAAKEAYPQLRKIFAERFARAHDDILQEAWGEDYREMMGWLDERPEIREELFNAVDPEHDRMVEAFRLFQQLREEFPDQFEDYAHLAIAVSLVWDAPRGAVVDYAHHAQRTHSHMPDDLLSAMDVFRYYVESESFMQGRAKFLPWEFLVWLVNDRTPLRERKWAVQKYLKRRSMIGKCYHDVPYDKEMLRTGSEICRLADKDYVLPNIREFGGVCAMQADFASRVAKSVGVPAEYVRGESRGGDLHAWVMWVELLNVKPDQIRFSLESHGRYRGDRYYVGSLSNAQTGQRMTDRELELHLHLVGQNPTGKRHADLAVEALHLLDEQQTLSVEDWMTTLIDILKLCPGHEPSWRKLANLAGSEELERNERRLMVRALESLFKTFAKFPDFTWTIFADLTRYEKDSRARIQLYQKLLKLYESADRPDLACEAALATADLLVEEDRSKDAVRGLSVTILKFADEGRYVPRMLDRMEEIYENQGGSRADLVSFYQKLLPKIPPKRGDRPSPYAIKMYQRGIACFKNNQRGDLATALNAKLSALQAGN